MSIQQKYSFCKQEVITNDYENVPELSCGSLISGSNGVFEYEVDTSRSPIKAVLSEISELEGISGIELKKPPNGTDNSRNIQ